MRPFQKARRRAIEQLELQAGERVLIIGAGTGLDLLFLPDTIAVTAIDITPAMIQRTAQRAQRLGREVTTAVMNAHHLGLPSARFDCVLLHLVLAVVPDPEACAREAAQVLKIGGRVSIFDKFLPDDATPSPLRRTLNMVTNTAFSDINRQLGPLLQQTSLSVQHTEAAGLGGAYQIVQALKAG